MKSFLTLINTSAGPDMWFTSTILASPVMEIGRITIQGQSRQKVSKTSISTNKLSMVVHICNASYVGGIARRSIMRGLP
jgi:hypothetical protein